MLEKQKTSNINNNETSKLLLENVLENPKLLFSMPIKNLNVTKKKSYGDEWGPLIDHINREKNIWSARAPIFWFIEYEIVYEWFDYSVTSNVFLAYKDPQFFNKHNLKNKWENSAQLCNLMFVNDWVSRFTIVDDNGEEHRLQNYYRQDKDDLMSWSMRDDEYLKWILNLEYEVYKSFLQEKEFAKTVSDRYLSIVDYVVNWFTDDQKVKFLAAYMTFLVESKKTPEESISMIEQAMEYVEFFESIDYKKQIKELIKCIEAWKIDLKYAYLDNWAKDYDQVLRASEYSDYFEDEVKLIRNNIEEITKNIGNIHVSYWGWNLTKESLLYSHLLFTWIGKDSDFEWNRRRYIHKFEKKQIKPFHDAHVFVNIETSSEYDLALEDVRDMGQMNRSHMNWKSTFFQMKILLKLIVFKIINEYWNLIVIMLRI